MQTPNAALKNAKITTLNFFTGKPTLHNFVNWFTVYFVQGFLRNDSLYLNRPRHTGI